MPRTRDPRRRPTVQPYRDRTIAGGRQAYGRRTGPVLPKGEGICCGHCGEPIFPSETRYGGGYVHRKTNRERCATGDTLAENLGT